MDHGSALRLSGRCKMRSPTVRGWKHLQDPRRVSVWLLKPGLRAFFGGSGRKFFVQGSILWRGADGLAGRRLLAECSAPVWHIPPQVPWHTISYAERFQFHGIPRRRKCSHHAGGGRDVDFFWRSGRSGQALYGRRSIVVACDWAFRVFCGMQRGLPHRRRDGKMDDSSVCRLRRALCVWTDLRCHEGQAVYETLSAGETTPNRLDGSLVLFADLTNVEKCGKVRARTWEKE